MTTCIWLTALSWLPLWHVYLVIHLIYLSSSPFSFSRKHTSFASHRLASTPSFCLFPLGIARPFFLESCFRRPRCVHSFSLPLCWPLHSLSPQQLVLMPPRTLIWLCTGWATSTSLTCPHHRSSRLQGQGSNQKPLRHFCDDESIDIIPIGFVNVFPDQEGANGYPGTNFANACGGSYYTSPDGKETLLLNSCPLIGEDIKYCQTQGKKVLLSLGGASPDVFIASDESAEKFADFLWGAFGPEQLSWEGPRPFGDASVDGFDFDIESEADKISGPVDFGYATMVDRFRHLYEGEEKTYYISASPQCIIPDARLSDAISKAIFDFL